MEMEGGPWAATRNALFLPSTLLMAISFEALAALVLRHLQTAFLLKVAHGDW